jgi:energy-coupling factor transporter ATP-binding protein EcfA2
MIIWITGQHNAGKTTLAKYLHQIFDKARSRTLRLDGDEWRSMTTNYDYSEQGRRINVQMAMQVALAVDDDDTMIVCSFISPFRDMRESFKSCANVIEVYLHNDRVSKTPERLCPWYQAPRENYLDVDNSFLTVEITAGMVIKAVEKYQLLAGNLVMDGGAI